MAPLSLQYFNGPIYKHDVERVLMRYEGAEDGSIRSMADDESVSNVGLENGSNDGSLNGSNDGSLTDGGLIRPPFQLVPNPIDYIDYYNEFTDEEEPLRV